MECDLIKPMTGVPPKFFLRLAHSYFAVARGMTLGVRAACFDQDGRLFLVRHSYIPGWHMPGGGVERGETVLQALEKELREEGNLIIKGTPDLVHVYFNTAASSRDHVVFYKAVVEQTAPRLPDKEIVECGFFTLDALPPDTSPATRHRLAELQGHVGKSDMW